MADVRSPREAELAPLVLFLGPEEFLFRKYSPKLRAQAQSQSPDSEIHRLDASTSAGGELDAATQASLFSPAAYVEVENLAAMTEAFLEDALAYLANPAPEVALVMHHAGGNRGKKLLDQLKRSAVVYDCATPKKDAEKQSYVLHEFRTARRRISPDAVTALVAAVGTSLAELDSACAQLIQDVPGDVDAATVDTYYGGRVEATAFKVADAALAGQTAHALGIARAAMNTGTDPVPLVAAIGAKVRSTARVFEYRGGPGDAAKAFGMAPWQAKNALADSRRWSTQTLRQAVAAVGEADYNVKGGTRNPAFVVERLIIEIGRLLSRR
ncbi:DNA polymerase III subunit delta [Falsarthrobacter nasiphocae]|uniref:DNA polymerase III subunit delta n=1 Tax=Falsarthrobacter nasiphocae TaxID=189863 RepID=A0AAE3YBT8_9MICC|nr:DNA polymerase III subunit delta [Falsarthrobacter nasiphocae]MDR6891063.1 DNA polymerase-3 subunit delta [Falsarthrobacter nasiphocae]